MEARYAPANASGLDIHLDDSFYGPSVAQGAILTYHVSYSNTGPASSNTVLHFTLPVHTNLSSVPNDPNWKADPDPNSTDYLYALGTVNGNTNDSVDFNVRVDGVGIQVPNIDAHAFITGDTNASPDLAFAPAVAALGTFDDLSTPVYRGIYAVSSGVAKPGHFASTEVSVFLVGTNQSVTFKAYPDVNGKVLRDSVRVAVGDFNGDGFDDVVTATAHGIGDVKIFDGVTGQVISSFAPFNGKKGLFVAAGDVTGDGVPDVVLGSALGGGSVKVYDGKTVRNDGGPTALGETFTPFGKTYKGGVRVAVGDLDRPSEIGRTAEIFVAQGNFGNKVNVYDFTPSMVPLLAPVIIKTIPGTFDLRDTFTVGGSKYRGGLNISTADLDGDFRTEVIVGRNRLSAAIVEIWGQPSDSGQLASPELTKQLSFTAFPSSYQQGVRVGVADVTGDGIYDIITASGFAGQSQVRVFAGHENFKATTLGPIVRPFPIAYTHDVENDFIAFPNPEPALWVAGSAPIPYARFDFGQPG